MAPHSSTLAWKIPWMEEPGRLQSMESRRVGHDWATSLSLFIYALEKEMATHSSVLAWRIPWMGEPGGLPSVGSNSAGHDWSDLGAPYITENYIQYPVIIHYRKEYFKNILYTFTYVLHNLYIFFIIYISIYILYKCINESLCCTTEINTILWINYTSITM